MNRIVGHEIEIRYKLEGVAGMNIEASAQRTNREEPNDQELKQYVDVEEALARVRGNSTVLKRLLKGFFEDSHFEQLKQEIENGEREAAGKTAHALKGVAGNLSLTVLYGLAQPLEAQLKSGSDTAEAFAAYEAAHTKTLRCIETVLKTYEW